MNMRMNGVETRSGSNALPAAGSSIGFLVTGGVKLTKLVMVALGEAVTSIEVIVGDRDGLHIQVVSREHDGLRHFLNSSEQIYDPGQSILRTQGILQFDFTVGVD